MSEYDRLANYGRQKDRECRYEPPPPTAEPRLPRTNDLTVAELERAFGVGQQANPAPRRP